VDQDTPSDSSVEHAGEGHQTSAPESELGQHNVFEATTEVVLEHGYELGWGQHDTLAKDTGHAYGIEEVGDTTASTWVFPLADVTVRRPEGVHLAVQAVE
jgi:hypothetical protein